MNKRTTNNKIKLLQRFYNKTTILQQYLTIYKIIARYELKGDAEMSDMGLINSLLPLKLLYRYNIVLF